MRAFLLFTDGNFNAPRLHRRAHFTDRIQKTMITLGLKTIPSRISMKFTANRRFRFIFFRIVPTQEIINI